VITGGFDPEYGESLGALISVVTKSGGNTLEVNTGAYYGEILRAGIDSVPGGQVEAARSTGLSRLQAMAYVVLPQAVRNVLPDLLSNTLEVVKLTSLGSVVAVPELWAAVGGDAVLWPTISGTIGNLEVFHEWVALIVVAILIWAAYHAISVTRVQMSGPSADPMQRELTPGDRLTVSEERRELGHPLGYLLFAVAAVAMRPFFFFCTSPKISRAASKIAR